MAGTMVTIQPNGTGETPGPRPPGGRGLLLAVAGLVIGIGMAVVFSGTPGEDVSAPDTGAVASPSNPPTTPVTTVTTVTTVPPRLAILVPGMLDTIVATAFDRTGDPQVSVWEPADRDPTPRALPAGTLVPDTSRQWLAAVTNARYTDSSTLWIGNSVYMEPLVDGVIGDPVWQASLPAELAWLERSDEGPVLRRTRFLSGRPAVPRDVVRLEEGSVLHGWNDSGFVVGNPANGTVTLVDQDGPGDPFAVGAVVAAGSDYLAAIDIEGSPILLNQRLDQIRSAPWSSDCGRGVFDPVVPTSLLLWCSGGTTDRIEYWTNALTASAPSAVVDVGTIADIGFTSDGLLAWIVEVDQVRPISTILFLSSNGTRTDRVQFPGRITSLATLRG